MALPFSFLALKYILPKPSLITEPENIADMICVSCAGICREDDFSIVDRETQDYRRELQETFRVTGVDMHNILEVF